MSDAMLTNADKILGALAEAGRPVGDTELTRVTGIAPRNQVNLICNRLARSGSVIREFGPDGFLVNRLAEVATGPVTSTVTGAERLAGSSHEHRAGETAMLRQLSDQIGVELAPQRLQHESGARVEIDGASPDMTVLVECWAHQGRAKVAQKWKLVNDSTKLGWIAGTLDPRPMRLILCVSDEAAVRHLRGKSWQARAIEALGVEIVVVQLSGDVVDGIVQAQERQFR